LLCDLLPGLVIDEVVTTPSGQRLVYFCYFKPDECTEYTSSLKEVGDAVLKVAPMVHAGSIARLEKEIEILGSINSKSYPSLYFFDSYSQDPMTEKDLDQKLFVTIEERIEGKTLTESTRHFSNESQVLELFSKLVGALKQLWCHPQKLVHRDLKPANILIKNNGDVVVIDLGIVREEQSAGITESWQPVGPCSPPYASPEQAKNEKQRIDFRSDLFSLGIIGYELLSGKNPFYIEGESQSEVLSKVVGYNPENLETLGVASPQFSGFIDKLMQKQPYKRFRKIEEVELKLHELIGR
jgi:serine/threonine-protein kinase